jgi:hypothetical protein
MTHPSKQALFSMNIPPSPQSHAVLRNISLYASRRNFPAEDFKSGAEPPLADYGDFNEHNPTNSVPSLAIGEI